VDLIAEGRVPVTRNQKSGYLDLAGKVAIPLVYDGVARFSEDSLLLRKVKNGDI